MEKIQLKASLRDIKTTKPAKLRKEGLLPAVLYGNKVQNVSLSVNAREFDKILKKAGESTVIDLQTEDGKNHPVLIHDIQNHYLTSVPTHVDFYEVSMTTKLKANVAIEFTGESQAVKALGGVLVRVLNEVEVECLPADLPHNIEVNVEVLKTLQDTVHVKDLKVPANVKILTPADELVIKVQPPRDVEAELAAPVVEDVSKVEGAAEEKPAAPAADAKAEEKK
ncbi:MAG: 50S ribosomal protein L25 [Candidatus Doudnabacteria bacterium]|nr:50S ribosomal protein L25 [Candidatus Doudnabacteria bacterium]